MKACFSVDKETGQRRDTPCCNSCGASWRLAGLDEASAGSPSGATQNQARGHHGCPAGGGMDCVMRALAAGPRVEIIASGLLELAPMSARSIDDATLCATGRWIQPHAKAAGPLPDCP